MLVVAIPNEFVADIAYVEELLTPSGWVCHLEPAATAVTLVLDHPLTVPYRLTLLVGEQGNREFVVRQLQRAEFMVIAESPRDVKHVSLLRGIRETAFANGWTSEVVAVLARLLRTHNVLTNEEADWLESAGVPWTDDTA